MSRRAGISRHLYEGILVRHEDAHMPTTSVGMPPVVFRASHFLGPEPLETPEVEHPDQYRPNDGNYHELLECVLPKPKAQLLAPNVTANANDR